MARFDSSKREYCRLETSRRVAVRRDPAGGGGLYGLARVAIVPELGRLDAAPNWQGRIEHFGGALEFQWVLR